MTGAVPRPRPGSADRAGRHAVAARAGAERRHRDRCLVHPGDRRGRSRTPRRSRLSGRGSRRASTLALKPAAGASNRTPDSSGVLAVRDRSGQETDVTLQRHAGAAPPPALAMPLRRVLGFAFLGGLILNLMPCVFPVLAMKALAWPPGAARGRMRGARGVLHRRRAGWPSPRSVARCWRRARPGRRPAGGSSSPRRCSSPRWPGCCSASG